MKHQTEIVPDLFGHVPAQTQCDWCNKTVPLTQATISTFHISQHVTEQSHYCGEDHALMAWRKRALG